MPGLVYKPLNVAKNEIRVLRVVHDEEKPSHLESLGTSPTAVPTFSLHNVSLDDFTDKSRGFMAGVGRDKITPSEHIASVELLKARGSYPRLRSLRQRPEGRWEWGDFRAISYVWGESTLSRQVMVNGHLVRVTDNLFDILELLWLGNGPAVELAHPAIWVDALSINQQDIEERNLQVRRMGDIYGQAFKTVAWVGKGNGQPQKGAAFIKSMTNEIRCGQHLSYSNLQRILDDVEYHEIVGFVQFVCSEYWTRLWIAQEVSLGKDNIIFTGHGFEMSYEDLNGVVKFSHAYFTTVGDKAKNRGFLRENHGGHSDTLDFGSGVCNVTTMLSMNVPCSDIVGIMRIVNHLNQSYEKDKVYGVLSLLDPRLSSMISPDYEQSVPTVFSNFTQAVITYTKSLDVISLSHPDVDRDPALATWVPDWCSNWELKADLVRRVRHRASGDTRARTGFKQHMLLSAEGFIFDTCNSLANNLADDTDPTLGTTYIDLAEQPDCGRLNAYVTVERTREALWRTMLADRTSDGDKAPPAYEVLLQVPWGPDDLEITTSTDEIYSSSYEVLRGMNCRLSIGGISLREYYATSEATDFSSDNVAMQNATEMAVYFGYSYRLTVTCEGYIGLAAVTARPGDKICILLGCSVPLILRPVEDTEHWELIGSCYVHGIMDGEAMEWLEDGRRELRNFLIC